MPIYRRFSMKNAISVWMCQIIAARCRKRNIGVISGIFRTMGEWRNLLHKVIFLFTHLLVLSPLGHLLPFLFLLLHLFSSSWSSFASCSSDCSSPLPLSPYHYRFFFILYNRWHMAAKAIQSFSSYKARFMGTNYKRDHPSTSDHIHQHVFLRLTI